MRRQHISPADERQSINRQDYDRRDSSTSSTTSNSTDDYSAHPDGSRGMGRTQNSYSTTSTGSRKKTIYQKLQQMDTRHDDGFEDQQFIDPYALSRKRRFPWRALALATILSIMGSLMITISIMLMVGYLDEKYADRQWPVMLLGCLMFIPGAYHIRIAYYAYAGEKGFSFDDIPDFD